MLWRFGSFLFAKIGYGFHYTLKLSEFSILVGSDAVKIKMKWSLKLIKHSSILLLFLIAFSGFGNTQTDSGVIRTMILDLGSVSIDSNSCITITERLRSEMNKTGFSIISESSFGDDMGDSSLEIDTITNKDSVNLSRKRIYPDLIISGTINKFENVYSFNLQLNKKSEGTLKSIQADYNGLKI